MHQVTQDLIKQVYQLQLAAIELHPDFAIMMNYQDAREFYYDLTSTLDWGFELNFFTSASLECRKDRVNFGPVECPPHPSTGYNVWCKFHGPGGDEITLIIKGVKDL